MRALLLIPLLAACQTAQPDESAVRAPDDTCGAAGYQWMVGKQLAAVTLPSDLNMRTIEVNMAITMDYIPERINVWLDADGRVDRLSCG